ncbi:MAG: S9 family peptidase [Micrococcales bacterium]|nr:S9 family peptidase [Micrococcales bacterium]
MWEFPLDGDARRLLTRGRSDRRPRFSPDGRVLAFLRAEGGAPQLHVVDARGGEPIALTDRTLGVADFAWSPDSRVLAFTARDPEKGRYGTVEGLEAHAEPPRRITTRTWSSNGLGWSTDRRTQLFLVAVPELDEEPAYPPAPTADGPAEKTATVPEARRLTSVDGDVASPFFAPGGREVWFVAALHETRDLDLRSDLHRVALDGGEPERMTASGPPRDVAAAAFGPDGAVWVIAAELGPTGLDFVGTNYALYRGESPDALIALTDAESYSVGAGEGLLVFDDAGRALVVAEERGRQPLLAVDAAGAAERLAGPDDVVLSVAAAAGRIIAAIASPASSGEVVQLAPEPRALSSLGAVVATAGLVRPTEEEHRSADGRPVHGWVAIPPGPGPHPVLLMIHGGPYTQYGVQLFDETQVYAGAGYAVVYGNPRGAAGYGQAHGRSIRERMGTDDLEDVLAFLDGAVAAHPELDGDRVGILGGSYGGYLTAWTIAHDQRFRAAVVERGFLDPEDFIGTSDIGAFFADQYLGADAATRRTQSPQAVVDRVRTPTLVMHSELDLRCPLSQATRYYLALKRHGVDTELLVFPGEDHELSRSGSPRHRMQRFQAILDWFGRYLPVAG